MPNAPARSPDCPTRSSYGTARRRARKGPPEDDRSECRQLEAKPTHFSRPGDWSETVSVALLVDPSCFTLELRRRRSRAARSSLGYVRPVQEARDPVFAHDHHAVAEPDDSYMSDEITTTARPLRRARAAVVDLRTRPDVDPSRRLVEDHNRRAVQQRLRQKHFLLVAAGQPADAISRSGASMLNSRIAQSRERRSLSRSTSVDPDSIWSSSETFTPMVSASSRPRPFLSSVM